MYRGSYTVEMRLQWSGKRQDNVGDLIARKRYAEAVEVLREQFRDRTPGPAMRMQFADLLVLAGGRDEAITVLIGLADELVAEGEPARALEPLEKAETIAPEREDIKRRLKALRPDPLRATAAEPSSSGGASTKAATPQPSAAASAPTAKQAAPALTATPTPPPRPAPSPTPKAKPARPAPAAAPSPTETLPPTSRAQLTVPPAPATPVIPEETDPALELIRIFRHPALAGAALGRRMLPATVLFRSLSDEELLAARAGFVVATFEEGDTILREGDGGKSIFVVVTGAVRVSVMNPDGRDFQIAALGEGDFFGEIAAISGRPRGATVVASGPCTVLEIQKPILDSIARHHADVRTLLEECYVERVSSPDAAAVRAVSIPAAARQEADEALRAHFGESRWGARMRLRLADALVQAGQMEHAVSILVAIADDLATAGHPAKAVALFKKIQRIRHRHVEELCLAPLVRVETPDPSAPEPPTPEAATAEPATAPTPTTAVPENEAAKRRRERARTLEDFRGWLGRVLRDTSDS